MNKKRDLKMLYVSPEVHKEVKSLAARRGVTINILINSLISHYRKDVDKSTIPNPSIITD